MNTSGWQLWDREGVAATIERHWQTSPLEASHRRALARLCAQHLSADLDVLEVGCGTGLVYERLVPALVPDERYTGVDVSERMLEIARRKFPHARFVAGDGYALRFPARAFDVALAFEVLGHLPAIGPFLRELARVARTSAIFTVWGAAHGVVDGREEIGGASFLHREYSHAYVLEQIREYLPGLARGLQVTVLSTVCRAYVLRRA